MKPMQLFLISLSILAIVSCGGGGSNDNNEQKQSANISSEEASEAAISILATAINSSNGGSTNSQLDQLKSSLSSLIDNVKPTNAQINATQTETNTTFGNCSIAPGSFSVFSSQTTPDNNNVFPISAYIDIDFDNYCLEFFVGEDTYRTLWNGDVIYDFHFTSQTDATYYYLWDLTYTTDTPEGIETNSYYVSETCVIDNNLENCTESYNYEADDGTEYALSDTVVEGDDSAGYDITGTITDNNGNTYTISFDGLKTCANGNFSEGSGSIIINNNDEIFIEFIDCNTFSMTYQGVSEIYIY